jgi:transcriptional regulator with XRE-family HTH domain
MTSSFGARLRQQREERGIPLSVIAGQTKIKVSLLEGLERDDLAHWPPGIFRRAYVRAYALAIGLNPDSIVTEFLAIYPERPEIVDPEVIAQESGGSSNGGAPTRLRHLFGSAVGSLSRLRRPHADERAQPQGTTGSSAVLGISRTSAPAPRQSDGADAAGTLPGTREGARPPTASDATVEKVDLAGPALEQEDTTLIDDVPMPVPAAAAPTPDLLAAADLCTALGRVENAGQMPPLLREAAGILGARGLIVWISDSIAEELQPALVYGYPDKLVAQLPRLKPDADNLTAAAFRSSETLTIPGNAEASAALAVPLLTPGGCAGVLALELPPGHEEADPVRAVAIVFAAMLAQLVGGTPVSSQLPADRDQPPSSLSSAV